MMGKKVELHLHLDGSLRAETVIDIAKQEKIKLPTYEIEEIKRHLVVDEGNKDLAEYLKKFDIPCRVMQSKYALERVTYELIEDLAREGTIYVEIRFAPHQHRAEGLSLDEVVEAVISGVKKAQNNYDIKVNLLLCILRHLPVKYGSEVLELVKKYLGKGVVGLDLAGAEAAFSVGLFKDIFEKAKKEKIPVTIHAGEAAGASSVWEAIEAGANRIGHGIRSFEDPKLVEYIKDNNIFLECCPISNYQTKAVEDFKSYPLKFYLEAGIKVSLNTDNRTVSSTNYDKEVEFLKKYTPLSEKDIMLLNENAIEGAFISRDEKKELLKKLHRNLGGTEMTINKYIDHTVLKATTTVEDIKKLCAEAKEHGFFSVCVNGSYVPLAKKELEGTDVKIAAVIGFPLGAMSKEAKVFETKKCIADGADEIDMVINVGFMKSGMYAEVEQEIREIKEAMGTHVLKVIHENCYLNEDEKRKACELSLNAGADFVKTSTGFGTGGSTVEDVALMKEVVGDKAQIKAAGGVRDNATAEKYIEMGVTRLGTSSGVSLVTTGKAKEGEY